MNEPKLTHQPTVFVFSNGNIAVTGKDGQQIPELQKSIVETICERLVAAGYDPTEFEFRLGTQIVTPFRVESGWNWMFA